MSAELQSNALPYVQAYIEKLAEYNLKPTELAVYLSLLSFTDKNDRTAFPSTRAIAERVHVGIRTAKKALDRLEEVRLITRKNRRRKDGTQTSSLYWVRAVFVADDPPASLDDEQPSAKRGRVPDLHSAEKDRVPNMHSEQGKPSAEIARHEPEPLLTKTTTPPAGAGKYSTYAERHPEMSESDLETAKRAAMADVIDMSGSRYVNNTLKDALEKAVAHVFETGGGEARVIARFLRGQSNSKDGDQYREHCVDFRGAAVEADELVEWSAWYRETYPDRTLVRRPAALAGSILAWRDRGGESKRPPSIADVWGIVN